MSADDALEEILRHGRWAELRPWLEAPADSVEGKELRAWYRSRRAALSKENRWVSSRAATDVDHPGCLRLLGAALAPADRAARWLPAVGWGWRGDGSGSDDLLVATMLGRGPDWCQAFLDAAAQDTVRKNGEHEVAWLGNVARELVGAGAARLPRTPTMATAWAAAYSTGAAHAKWVKWREAQGQEVDPSQDGLADLLRRDPAVADGVSLLLSGPGAVGQLEYFLSARWDLAAALAELVADGLLDRTRVLEDTLAALTRQDTAGTQKGLARILTALGLSGEDLRGRLPLAQGLLATGRGPVTAALLPAVLEVAAPEDLDEVARTIFTRTEKAQQKTLLAALTAKDAVARWDRPSVVAALAVAADVPDPRLAARATTALEKLGESTPEAPPEAPVDDLWAPPPPVTVGAPVTAVAPHARSLTEAASRFGVAATPADAALLTDALVRWCATDPHAAREWASSAVPQATVWLPALVYAVHEGRRPSLEDFRTRNEQVSAHLTSGKRPRFDDISWNLYSRSAPGVLHDGVNAETAVRLGEVPFLLSTPTHEDGSLAFDALIARLREYAVPAGPLDLTLALLRLQPVDPGRAADLDGLSLPLWSAEKSGLLRRRPRTRDAVDAVREWVTSGGLPPSTAHHRGAHVLVDPAHLPAGVGDIPGVPGALSSGHDPDLHDEYDEYNLSVEAGTGVVPAWVDLLAARLQKQFDQSSRGAPRWLAPMAASPSPGLAVTHAVAQTLCHADEDHRLVAVDAALVLMGRGRWVPDDYTACCLHQLADGELRLTRLSHAWEQLALGGGLQPLWPTVLAVLDAACALNRKPPGLADLLAVVRRLAPAVPDVRLPGSVRTLAGSKGGSKARLEAVALVEAVS
ncbi:hypothetical protein [Nocardioides marmoribigeumensis]|uniref:Secreted protein n=1 Tax=Nocardioides marmoribigeumensis TaxID=433649 RepID=A0ABU2BQ19_9ACTN|nr:hypothetical protein [Nocardioides marmoribigeumensis]MDR7360720.1 hypothetical protein [Nocardioides marmoribigeumensis]